MGQPDEAFDFKHVPIGLVLKEGRLAVPINQRSYCWPVESADELFHDLKSAKYADEPRYFLGTIVLTECGRKGPREIADGQQRLATTAILIAAIRDHFQASGDQVRAREITREYLLRFDLHSQLVEPNLLLNVTDRDYFRNYILELSEDRPAPLPPETLRRSHERLAAVAPTQGDRVQDQRFAFPVEYDYRPDLPEEEIQELVEAKKLEASLHGVREEGTQAPAANAP